MHQSGSVGFQDLLCNPHGRSHRFHGRRLGDLRGREGVREGHPTPAPLPGRSSGRLEGGGARAASGKDKDRRRRGSGELARSRLLPAYARDGAARINGGKLRFDDEGP
jgi:hypothetical protein